MAKKGKAKKKPEQRSEMVEKKILSIIEEKGDKYARSNRRLEMSMDKLEVKTTRIFGGIIVVGIVIIVFAVFGCHKVSKLDSRIEAVKEAQSKFEQAQSKFEQAQSKFEQAKDNESNYEIYLDSLFPSDGTLYEPAFADFTFYSDIDCMNEIQNVKFASKDVCTVWPKDGGHVYSYRMNNGKICYSKSKLYINEFTECE